MTLGKIKKLIEKYKIVFSATSALPLRLCVNFIARLNAESQRKRRGRRKKTLVINSFTLFKNKKLKDRTLKKI